MTQLKTANGTAGQSFVDIDARLDILVGIDVTDVAFGAVGDGVTDDTAAFQAAIDYVEDNLEKTRVVYVPAGNYVISGITLTTACLRGESASRSLLGITTVASARLIHKSGATTPLITMAGGLSSNLGWERVEHLSLQGRQKTNVSVTKKAIVSASDRTHFTVAVADLPTAADDVAAFPHYGLCMFYDANGQRLGSGIVQSVNGGTGVVTLKTGTDNYTGKTGSSNLMTSTEKVAFAPIATYTGDGVTLTNVSDSTMISPPAILVQGRTKVIEWVDIRDFHCSIVQQDTVTQINHFWSHNHGMAAYALRTLGAGADVWGDNWFLQGRGYEGYGEPARTVGVIDTGGYQSMCGMWGVPTAMHLGEVMIEAHMHAIVDKGGGSGAHFDYLLLDGTFKEAILTWGSIWILGTASPLISIDQLHVRTLTSSYTALTAPNYPTSSRTIFGIPATDAGRRFHVNTLHCNRFDSASPASFDYATVHNITGVAVNGSHEVSIGAIPWQSAVTTPLPTRNRVLSATATWDPASVAAAAQATTTVTVTGAALGDPAGAGFNKDLQAMQLSAYVSAADTVTVVLQNGTAGALDLASGTLRVTVDKWT